MGTVRAKRQLLRPILTCFCLAEVSALYLRLRCCRVFTAAPRSVGLRSMSRWSTTVLSAWGQSQDVAASIDPYSVLGLSPGCSTEEIRRAYRKIAIERHPDRNGGTEEAIQQFRIVVQAYETLAPDGKKSKGTPDEEEVLSGAIDALTREIKEKKSCIAEFDQQIEELKKESASKVEALRQQIQSEEASLQDGINALKERREEDTSALSTLRERLEATKTRRREVVGDLRVASGASAALAGAAIAGPVGAAAGFVFGTLFADEDSSAGKLARSVGKLGQKVGEYASKQAASTGDDAGQNAQADEEAKAREERLRRR
eukprot:TRINITY_DN39120_c0_g1_i1.p1 TRINITY_DN39120_c0_g1~~TRINITY_DN39120_c0_g1_i1.p1  ORF type:complete len:316 (-),score=80.07 TRINITY_DN39120_c0_g1_i1:81-1028(-)